MKRPWLKRWLALGLCGLVLLACDISQIGQTITATPNLTPATALSSATAIASPQTPIASASPFPSATFDPQSTAAPVNPCQLVNKDEAASAIGEPVVNPIPAGGGCIYTDSGAGHYIMSFYALPSNNTAELIAGRAYILVAYGIQVSQADLQNLQAQGKQGDAKGVVQGLVSLTENATSFTAQPIDGLGDGAIWVSRIAGQYRQAFLLAARGDALVGLDILVTVARDESSVRDAAVAVVKQMLVRLPQRFIVIFPTSIPTLAPTLASTLTPSATVSGQPTATAHTATATVRPGTATQTLAPTQAQSQTVAGTPTLKPPAFSVPIVSNDQVTYGGDCGLSLTTITATVVDPSQVSPIATVNLVVRINDPISGRTTDWRTVPMKSDTHDLWLHTLNAETELPGHEQYANGFIEYYFSATNAAGITAESPHYGLLSYPLVLTACATATPTP
jgi:hypothetical protein